MLLFLNMSLGSNEGGSETVSEPIETSVVSLDAGMIVVQPIDSNQAGHDDSGQNVNELPIIIDLNNPTAIVSSNEAEVTPSRKKRKR